MEFSTLNNSFRFSFDINLEGCVEAIAEAASNAAFNATKSILDRAIADTRSVIAAERTAKDTIWNIATTTFQLAEAIIEATDTRVDAAIEAKVLTPVCQAKTAIAKPIVKGWNTGLDIITDYLETTPIKAAPVAESFPASQIGSLEEAIAQEVPNPIETQNEINAALMKETPQLIDGAIVSSAGVTNAIDMTDAVEEVQPKASSSLSELIREEVAKH